MPTTSYRIQLCREHQAPVFALLLSWDNSSLYKILDSIMTVFIIIIFSASLNKQRNLFFNLQNDDFWCFWLNATVIKWQTQGPRKTPPSFLVLVFGIWHEASGRANPLGFFIIQNFKPLKKKKEICVRSTPCKLFKLQTHCILFEKRKKNEANPHFL